MCSENYVKMDPPHRIYLWTNVRSLGTVFLKCLSQLPDSQVINGMIGSCYFYGPESQWGKDAKATSYARARKTDLSDFSLAYDASNTTYQMAKSHLEADYPGKKVLICKDLAYTLCGNHDLIPKGFRHTFLIRHPYRVYPSYRNSFGNYFSECGLKEILDNHNNKYYNYKEQYELVKHLMSTPELGDTNPVIFDADDLQSNPDSVLRQYCEAVGTEFTEKMLQWSPGVDVVKTWKISKQLLGSGIHETDFPFYKTAMESSEFFPPRRLPERSELDEDILSCADIGMPYYEALYAMRTIKP